MVHQVHGNGRLIDPPSRSIMWRYGFDTPKNYDDNHTYCGGFGVQWSAENKGKCGIYGDPYNGKRDNEVPDGIYAKKVIVRTYKEGDAIESKLWITSNERGYFVFKICPALDDKKEVTQECLDGHLLKVLNSNSTDKYVLPTDKADTFVAKLQLPTGLTCDRCVFQWTYTTATRYDKCPNGTSALGCGPQETFRAFADVKIVKK